MADAKTALRAEDCEHEKLPQGEGTCPDCGMVFIYCRGCSEAGGAVYHDPPACRSSRDSAPAPKAQP